MITPADHAPKQAPPRTITSAAAERICKLNGQVAAMLRKAPDISRRSVRVWEKADAFNESFEPLVDELRKELDAAVPARGFAFHQSAPCGAEKTFEEAWDWLNAFHNPAP